MIGIGDALLLLRLRKDGVFSESSLRVINKSALVT